MRTRRPRRVVLATLAAGLVAGVSATVAVATHNSSVFLSGGTLTPGAEVSSAFDSAALRFYGVEWYSKSNTGGSAWIRIALIASDGSWSCSTTGTLASGSCTLGSYNWQKKGHCRNNGSVTYTVSCRALAH